jgi:hypothetical protein
MLDNVTINEQPEGGLPRRTSFSPGARCRDIHAVRLNRVPAPRPSQTRPMLNRHTAPLWEVCGIAKFLSLSIRRKRAVKRSAVTNQMKYVFYVLYRTEATPRLR